MFSFVVSVSPIPIGSHFLTTLPDVRRHLNGRGWLSYVRIYYERRDQHQRAHNVRISDSSEVHCACSNCNRAHNQVSSQVSDNAGSHSEAMLTGLSCAPIVSTLEVVVGTDRNAKPNKINKSRFMTTLIKSIFRLAVTVVIVLLAILVPTFELISAIMGAAFCFLICIIMPVVFHLKMFRGQITKREQILDWTLIAVSTILGIIGTLWEFLPR